MIEPTKIVEIAHLLAGDSPGWQTRFATMLGVSRGYAHNLLTGAKVPNTEMAHRILELCISEAAAFQERIKELETIAKKLPNKEPGDPT